MKQYFYGALGGIVVAAVAVASFMIGKGCNSVSPSHQVGAPPLDISALQGQIDSLRILLEEAGYPQEVLIKVSFHGDTIYSGFVPGTWGETSWGKFLHYHDSLVDITVYPDTTPGNPWPTFEYYILPHEYGMLMGVNNKEWVWAKTWDITTGDTLTIDSIRVSHKKQGWRWTVLGGASYDLQGKIRPEIGLGVRKGSWGINVRASDRIGLFISKEF